MSNHPSQTPSGTFRAAVAVGGIVLLLAGSVMAISWRPEWALLGVMACLTGAVLFRWPQLATCLALFILFTNAADVAVTFHGLPFVVGATFILLWLIPLFDVLVRGNPLVVVPTFLLMLAYLIIQVLSAMHSYDPQLAMRSVITFLVEGIAIFLLLTNVIRTPKSLVAAMWTLMISAVVMSALPIYQQATAQFDNNFGGFAQTNERGFKTGLVTEEGGSRQRRLSGSIGEHNRYAQIMFMLVPIGVGVITLSRSWPVKGIATLATGMAAAGMFVAFSRGAAVGFVILLAVGGVLGYLRKRYLVALVVCGVVLLVSMPQFLVRLASIKNVVGMMSTTSLQQADGAVRTRVGSTVASLLIFLDHPLLGVGPGLSQFQTKEYGRRVGLMSGVAAEKTPAHMIFADVAADTGLLGLFCVLAVCLLTLHNLHQSRILSLRLAPELSPIVEAFFLALVAYFATGLFLHFAFIRFFWAMMALATAASCIVQQRCREKSAT